MVTDAVLVRTDLEHGGRWTSLRIAGREWLWQRPEPARDCVAPGDAFVDAGGLEECLPTVRGTPDHGSAWSRAWQRHGGEDVAECGEFVLRRRVTAGADTVDARYRIEAAPGYRFVWAAHALLDLDVGARVLLPDGAPLRLYPEAAASLPVTWPADASYVDAQWPAPFGLDLATLGPDDGSAVGATVLDTHAVEVVDGGQRLRMRVDADPDVPVSISLWRNLGGFPAAAPYRSVGVEPMLGRVFDLAEAGPGDAVIVPEAGRVEWTLRIGGSR